MNSKKKTFKKKLVIFVPSIEDGGVEKNLFIISNYFADRNIQVNLITANKNKKKFFKKNINFISPNSNYLNNKNRFYKTIYCFFRLFIFFMQNKNILIFSFQANIYAIFFSCLFGVGIITRSNTAPPGWSSNIIKRVIFKFFFKYPHKIIVNSYEFKKKLDKEFKVNSHCIYNPFDDLIIKNKIKKKIKLNFFKKNTFNFINIGRMTDQKDQIVLLKAFSKINNIINFRLIVLGKGKNYNILQNYIDENNLNKKIKLLGYKSNPYPYINKSDVFILTSKFEGLPNVLLEAQFLNKIIISSKCPTGPKEILLGGKAGFLFDVGNVNQLKNKIIYICNKKNIKLVNIKKKIGLNSIKRFSFEKNLKQYEKLINKYL